MMLPTLAHRGSRELSEDDTQHRAWVDLHNRILDNCSEQVTNLSAKHFALCFTAVAHGDVSLQNLVDWHGIESIFRSRRFYLTDRIRVIPIGVTLLLHFLKPAADSDIGASGQEIELVSIKHIGRLALTVKTPWIEPGNTEMVRDWTIWFEDEDDDKGIESQGERKTMSFNPDQLFGIFTLAAILTEATDLEERRGTFPRRPFSHLRSYSDWPIAEPLRRTLLARFDEKHFHAVQDELEGFGFSHEQESIVRAWIRKDISFISDEPSCYDEMAIDEL